MKVEDLDDDAEHDETETPEEELLEQARKRFKFAQEAEQKQRQRERDDLRFQIPEEQWDEAARRQRLGYSVEGVPTPARPILSISKIDQPVQLLLNQERTARLGVQIGPLSPDADPEVARILEGIYRRIERDSQAGLARSWAFERAVKAGRGAYLVNTQWADEEGGDDFDQVITIERILHQDSVYFDPAATKADFSDGEYAFLTAWVPVQTFKRRWPKSKLAADDGDVSGELTWADVVREQPDWTKGSGDTAAVLVARYFYKVHTPKTVTAKDPDGKKLKREKDEIRVHWADLTGFEVLEEGETNGRYIPIVPTIGRELQPFDAERRWVGVIGPAKDAQRLYNYAASSAVELAALEPKAPWVGADGQFEGHDSEWQQANIRNLPYLEYKPVTVDGQMAPPPARAQIDVGRLGPSMALLQQADNFIQATTAVYDPSLGRISSREKSGKAIMALQSQAESGNSNYMDNLAKISLAYEARVILDLIPAIYDRPGRIARVLDDEGESETVLLNHPFYPHPETKMPVPLQPGETPPAMPAPGGPAGMPPQGPQGAAPVMQPSTPKVRHYDLRKGTYSVAVNIGKQRQTAMQETSEEMSGFLQAMPALMPVLGPIYFRNRDFPGAREIADVLAKLRDKTMPGLGDKDEGPTPEQAAARVQQLEQQIQQMGMQLQMMGKTIETEQVKQQIVLQKAQMDNETKLRIAAAENETKLTLAGLEQKFNTLLTMLGLQHEARMAEQAAAKDAKEQGIQVAHDAGSQARDHLHEAALTDLQQQHEMALATSVQEAQPTPEGEP